MSDIRVVSIYHVLRCIASVIAVSDQERIETLKLRDEMVLLPEALKGVQSSVLGGTWDDAYEAQLSGFARKFSDAHRQSQAASKLDNVLHHAHLNPSAELPMLFDARLTRIPRFAPEVLNEIQEILIDISHCEARIVRALEMGVFKGYPIPGGRVLGLGEGFYGCKPGSIEVLNKVFIDFDKSRDLLDVKGVAHALVLPGQSRAKRVAEDAKDEAIRTKNERWSDSELHQLYEDKMIGKFTYKQLSIKYDCEPQRLWEKLRGYMERHPELRRRNN